MWCINNDCLKADLKPIIFWFSAESVTLEIGFAVRFTMVIAK